MNKTYQHCTACRRCETVCPENTPISEIMALLRELDQTGDESGIRERYRKEYRMRTGCVNCGRCLPYCPEKITIPYFIQSAKEDLA